MTSNEASYIIKKSEDDFIDKWNRTRYIVYSVIQSQSTTSLQPTDVLKFPWEDNESPILPSKTKEELIKHGLEMEKKLNINNGR